MDIEPVYAFLTAAHADRTPAEVAATVSGGEEEARAALTTLEEAGRAVRLPGETFLSDVAADRLIDTARRVVGAFHRRHPLKRAIPVADLPDALSKAALVRDFGDALAFLVGRGVLATEGDAGARLPEHAVTLPPDWQAAADEILAVYRAAGLTPPSPGNFQAHLPRVVRVDTILEVLTDRGDLARLADRLYVSAETIASVKETLRRVAAEDPEGRITVGAARDALGSSRKMVLPLLEYLDAVGFTRREGEARVIVAPSPD